MNLAIRDVKYRFGRFLMTAFGLGLLLATVMAMGGIYRGMVEDALSIVRAPGARYLGWSKRTPTVRLLKLRASRTIFTEWCVLCRGCGKPVPSRFNRFSSIMEPNRSGYR